ncbi:MAG: domain S-box protein [Acidobacteriaceae bacterium]|nr:domain S-box protein [Acidobacteriaceae bacterium]
MQASPPFKSRGISVRYIAPAALAAVVFWTISATTSRPHAGMSVGSVATLVLGMTTLGLMWRERERALEQRLMAEADERFIAAAENGLDAFALMDAVRDTSGYIHDFRFRYVNAKTEEIMGLTRDEIVGQMFHALLPDNYRFGFFERCCKVVETGHPMDEESPVKTGRVKASWLRSRVVKLGDGVAITSINLTEAKAVQKQYEVLANFSESVFESAPFSIIATDPQGLITSMNAAAERLSQYTRDELIGNVSMAALYDVSELQLQWLERGGGPEEAPNAFALLTSETTAAETEEREWTYVRKDGTRAPVSLSLRAIRSHAGELEGYIGIASDITDRRQLLSYVTHLSKHDPLTGLAGRAMLREKLQVAVERAKVTGRRVAVFVMDLDHFKRVNDSLGHQAGDQVIREAAQQLRSAVRSTDIVGRMGGDEFVVILTDIQTIEDIDQFAQTLVQRISRTMTVNQYELNVTASVGVCIYPDFANDADSLLERADAAMYESKEGGRNQHLIFNSAMLKESSNRLQMEHELRFALKNDEFSLVYQPQVDLRTGDVVGLEALLRWNNSRLGQVSPGEFIPLAEETGLIVPIGEWVFRQACLEGKRMGDAVGRELSVAINLSPRQFRQKNLLEVIERALLESGLAARNLEIEITENTLMINSAANLEMLQKIRELGGRIAIDDFGTGFCSFSYLLEYHVDRLKIDQSFVRRAVVDSNAAAVVRTVLAMSHGLNIKVVAEGVETAEQLRFLRRRRCDEAQGFLFARPVSAEDFPGIVDAVRREWQNNLQKFAGEARPAAPTALVPPRHLEILKDSQPKTSDIKLVDERVPARLVAVRKR